MIVKRNAMIATFYKEYKQEAEKSEFGMTRLRLQQASEKKKLVFEQKRNRSLEMMEFRQNRPIERGIIVDKTLTALTSSTACMVWTSFVVKYRLMALLHRKCQVALE